MSSAAVPSDPASAASRSSGVGRAVRAPGFRAATCGDVPALVELVESAYRARSGLRGWTTEVHLLTGQRADEAMVTAAVIGAGGVVLVAPGHGPIRACCHLERRDGYAYFGMFAVHPAAQGGGLGRALLAEAERYAHQRWNAAEMRLTVIAQREDLIAWYVRRGYSRTGEVTPFPYGDERFGVPLRDDLRFETFAKKLA